MTIVWNPGQIPRPHAWILDDDRDTNPATLILDISAPDIDTSVLEVEIPLPSWWPRRPNRRTA